MKKIDHSTHSSTYIREIETRLLNNFKNVIRRNDPEAANLLDRKYILQASQDPDKNIRRIRNRRMRDYAEFWESLDNDQRYRLASNDAKINHLARLSRTMGTTEVVQAHNKIKATTAGSFDYVLRRFREEGVTAAQLQNFIDENAVAWFSLTGHPTNPTTVAYTEAQIDLARIIADPEAATDDLDRALQVVYETPIVGPQKTPIDEAREIIATLHVLYDMALPHKRLFESSLREHGYDIEGVTIRKPLIVPCVWTLGDGDGNENLTAAVLGEGINLHRTTIAARYLSTLETVSDQTYASDLQEIKTQIKSLSYTRDDLVLRLETLALRVDDRNALAKQRLFDLAYLVKCFGTGFATIDIRHNAIEILDTVNRLGALAGEGTMQEFEAADLDHTALRLAEWLKDETLLKKFAGISVGQFLEAKDEPAARIFGRLQIIGRNPDMCDKLIIAETTHTAHALAALLLLKVTGNKVAEEGSRIDVTILSESVQDLMNLGNTLEHLLENDMFRKHVASRKRLLTMIAKSDTTRQDGRGEAEYWQYEAAVDIFRIADQMSKKYPELEDVKISIKNGGGHALQRGGGRVTEIAALHGRAAADARVTDCGPSTLTIQGEQLTILFCPGKVALGSLEAFVSQNLYTKAGVRGEMPVPHFPKTINKQYAEADAWLYAKTAGQAFDKYTKTSNAIDTLLIHAPWLAMKAGNVSSRPAKRGEKLAGPGIKPIEAKGKDPKALQGRAISGERLTAHACLPVFSVLGLVEAMQAVHDSSRAKENPQKYGEPLHHLYRAHKMHRDGARVTINAVPMADFDIAWPLLTGKIRPNPKQIDRLVNQFQLNGEPDDEATLAFLEHYFLEVEKLSYEMVSGQKAGKTFSFGDALRKLWPELAEEVEHRNQEAEFARVIECYRTRQFDKHDIDALTEIEFRITQALYAAANVINAPVGILATRTRLEPVSEFVAGKKTRFMRPGSFNENEVHNLLKIPSALI